MLTFGLERRGEAEKGRRGEEVGVLDGTSSTWGDPKTGVPPLSVESKLPLAQR
ncbi:hypothetical protein I8752_04635 [Nostocaceae cyanobacterium CENA369]|uniref:Uncharacterized protein n=1 Tax=Dendronalium phyllosphericum CENA369 TaxID=1725256 RepID=A0A8J7I2P4_9NOST|nr:hypothetical protein [Dendronalium phyllosphericum]MBH8572330.1 hypothetical protein [Dendronalium phyllosphericum CENA369]